MSKSLKEKVIDVLATTDLEMTESVRDIVLDSFISINKDNYFITSRGEMFKIGKASDSYDLIKGLLSILNKVQFFPLKELEQIINIVCPMMRYENFEEKRDLLSNFTRWERNEDKSTISLIRHGLSKKETCTVDDTKMTRFIEEYREHFPQLDEVVDHIVMGRISPSKASFLSINAPSDWGKSFFIGALEESSLGIEIQDHKRFIENTGSSSTPINSIVNSLCLCFDEFEYFNDNMKNITSHVQIAEKYKMSKKVELGIKILFNANISASFMGAIDEQVTNRINIIVIDKKCKKLIKRKTFVEFGDQLSRRLLSKYIHKRASIVIQGLKRSKNPQKDAFDSLIKFNKDYSLRKLEGNSDVFEELRDILLLKCHNKMTDFSNDRIFQLEDGFFIKSPKKMYKELLSDEYEESELKHKMGLFSAFVSKEDICVNHMSVGSTINSKTTKGIMLKFTQKFAQEEL